MPTQRVVDPRVADAPKPDGGGGPSLLSLIEQDVARQQEKRRTTPAVERVDVLGKDGDPVAGREGWAFDFSTRISEVDYLTVESEASQPELPGGVSHVNRGLNLAVRLCRGFVYRGEEVKDDQGQRLTFTSQAMQQLVGADNPRDCVAKVWIDETGEMDEATIGYLGQELLTATGWANRQRPTKRA